MDSNKELAMQLEQQKVIMEAMRRQLDDSEEEIRREKAHRHKTILKQCQSRLHN